ncbi:MAG: hypothetical protein JO307_06485 [Bryobacterales bacterium]|nr:hypothetical protein [Bryobacterales bacterium]MBV9401947.1 hypothetical protein [Bryobacterales bacterium]
MKLPTRLARLAIFLFPALAWGQIQQAYVITTIAGGGGGVLNFQGFSGDGGDARQAQLAQPVGLLLDNKGNLYIADQVNNRIRQVVLSSNVITTIAGTGTAGYSGDGGAATSATLNAPLSLAMDASGNLYIADTANDVVREITANGNIGTAAGLYGAGFGFGGDGGAPSGAIFNQPSAITFDSAGNLYIADTVNNRVRRATFGSSATTRTIAGQGTAAFTGDNVLATFSALNKPRGVAIDPSGNIYVADTDNNRIRKIDSHGIITTVAGTGVPGFSGDGGPATRAQLNSPRGIALDASGNLYIADYLNSRVREIVNGTITTIAGGVSPVFGYGGDGSLGTQAVLNFPSAVAVDNAGNVYIADTQNNAIRLLTPTAAPPAIKKGGVQSAGEFGAFFSAAPGSWIEIYGSSLASDARPWAAADFNGIYAPYQLDNTTVTIGGQYAFISYISGGQVNVQVPTTLGPGQYQLFLSTSAGTSAAYPININTVQPGLYAKASFAVNGKQYVVAQLPDGTYVAPPNSIPNITSRQAKPGETITIYGIGFGPVTPETPAGQITTGPNTLNTPVHFMFGQTPASVSYAGLAPGSVGLYQFNIVVPNVSNNDLLPLTFTVGGVNSAQTLYTAVHN